MLRGINDNEHRNEKCRIPKKGTLVSLSRQSRTLLPIRIDVDVLIRRKSQYGETRLLSVALMLLSRAQRIVDNPSESSVFTESRPVRRGGTVGVIADLSVSGLFC